MSWRWLIDVRDGKSKVDWARLAIVLSAAELSAGVLLWLLGKLVGPIVAGLILVPIGAALVWLDVKLRRQTQ